MSTTKQPNARLDIGRASSHFGVTMRFISLSICLALACNGGSSNDTGSDDGSSGGEGTGQAEGGENGEGNTAAAIRAPQATQTFLTTRVLVHLNGIGCLRWRPGLRQSLMYLAVWFGQLSSLLAQRQWRSCIRSGGRVVGLFRGSRHIQ